MGKQLIRTLILLCWCVGLLPATDYAYTDAGLYWLGGWHTQSTWQQRDCGAGDGNRLEFIATGSAVSINSWDGAGYTLAVTVDGGSATTYNPGGTSAFVWRQIFTAGSDETHRFVVYSTGTNMFVQSAASVRVTGAAPGLTSISDYELWRQGTKPLFAATAWTSYGQLDGSPKTNSFCTISAAVHGRTFAYDGAIRFVARTGVIGYYYWGDPTRSSQFVVYQDGAAITSPSTAKTDSQWHFSILATGLDASTTHEYVIRDVTKNPTSHGYGVLVSGTGFVAVAPARNTLAIYGDSIIEETAVGAVTDARQGWMRMALAIGYGVKRWGSYGMQVSCVGAGSCLAQQSNINNIAGATPVPKAVILEGGTNDAAAGITIGSCADADNVSFKGAYYQMISRIAAGLAAGSVIYSQDFYPSNSGFHTANRSTYIAAKNDCVAQWNATSPTVPVRVVSTDNWIVPATDTIDGLHPNATGYAKIAQRWSQILGGMMPESVLP